jgi:hypothetical protein
VLQFICRYAECHYAECRGTGTVAQRSGVRKIRGSPVRFPARENFEQYSFKTLNEGISAVSFCRQVAALVTDIFYNFYLVKNHKIANNSATTEAREKTSTYLESLEF